MANGHGGARSGAGRPKNSSTKRSQEAMALAEEMGVNPVAIMLELTRWSFEEFNKSRSPEWADKVRDYAKECAPYVSPKLAAVEASGPDGGPMEVVSEIVLKGVRATARD